MSVELRLFEVDREAKKVKVEQPVQTMMIEEKRTKVRVMKN